MLRRLLDRFAPAPAEATPTVAASDVPRADRLIEQGNAREDAGDVEGAEGLYREATAAAPGHARAWLNLGIALAALQRVDDAARAYDTVLAIDRQHANGHYNYARLEFLRGDFARAEARARAALAAKPAFPQALVVLSNALESQERLDDAAVSLEAAAQLQPDDAGIWYNLAVLGFKRDRRDDAEVAVRRLLELDAEHPAGLAMLSRALREQEFPSQLLEPLRRAIRNDPDFLGYQSQELMLLNFVDGLSAAEVHARHVAFGQRLEARVPARFDRWAGPRDPERRLRIGFLSGDLHAHPVSLFLLPLLEHLDRAQVEVTCYAIGVRADVFTQRLRAHSDHWRAVRDLADPALADRIHADAIDILVDLTGHTASPRLGVFAQRPAPVQATWIGYLNTTGLSRIDWRLSDARTDPLERSQALHSERLLLLPDSQWCYRPFAESTVSERLPFEANGFVTFGSFNSSLKLTEATVRRWAELLHRVPGARLRIGDVPSARRRAAIERELRACSIAPERFDFLPRVDLAQYYDFISSVDIALDSHPYGGGTTTFDALWMGVPVVTATGDLPVSRSAASVLAALGLDDWIAPGIDDVVDLAVARAADRDTLRALRPTLRPRLQASPLTDQPRFARSMEAAFRRMWRDYCARV